ncbi:MAG: hypothetical protein QNK23_00780 [Crocinitomicaceae bacterium]|nr:hypothetical protein [Crocinitomicaceae bacterium]
MNKRIAVAFVLGLSSFSFAQQNTLPTTGNVGIGTLTPSATLDVNGRAIIDSTLLVKDSVRIQKNLRIDQDLRVLGKIVMQESSVAQDNFKILGNLKIPNTSEIGGSNFGNGTFDLLLLNPNGIAKKITYESLLNKLRGGIYIPEIPEVPGTLCDVAGVFPVWSNGPQKLFTDCPQTNIGIRTGTPAFALHVQGDGYFSSHIGVGIEPQSEVQLNSRTARKVGFCIDHNYSSEFGYAYKAIINDITTKGIGIYSNIYNKDIFTVYGDGTIEVSNDTHKILKLESNGLLHARRIKVDADVWPDYVFGDNYELRPLREVEEYIEQEGHLPNFPSAEEVVEEGMDLGDMNVRLMEKVEELTLYMIQQQKEIELLKEEINKLKD